MNKITQASDDFTQSLFKALIYCIASHSSLLAEYYSSQTYYVDVTHLCLLFCLIASDTSPTSHTKQNLKT